MSRRYVLGASAVAAGFFIAAHGRAQAPAFEAASIRLANDLPVMTIGPGLRNGRLNAGKVTPRRMLATAFGLTEPLVIGPAWLDKNRFDIVAKAPEGVPDSELGPMFQTLPKERFGLAAHLETREMAVYSLVVAKGGVKMPLYPDPGPDRPGNIPGMRGGMVRGTMTRAKIAASLALATGRPVPDRTGLTELYSVFLYFAPLTPQTGDGTPEFGPPDLFTAVQDQLGLNLEPGKDSVEVVVIDHLEQLPTEN